jgi:hypothetical protein
MNPAPTNPARNREGLSWFCRFPCRNSDTHHVALSVSQEKSAPFDAVGDGMHTEVALFDAMGIDE